jgi:uracil-DNA glycosylase
MLFYVSIYLKLVFWYTYKNKKRRWSFMFNLKNDWQTHLELEFEKDYYITLINTLKTEYKTKSIYPAKDKVFNALNITSYKNVKVVIIGQDPYHQKGQAHGLSFSVEKGVKTPPSLKNIYKELSSDLGCFIPNNGNLNKWAKQGVLLINSVLTVQDSNPNIHKNLGWQNFTLKVIKQLNKKEQPIVFMLWGANAKAYNKYIDQTKHYILTSTHPSPLSAYRGFFGCKHFSKSNKFLTKNNQQPIDWQIENI